MSPGSRTGSQSRRKMNGQHHLLPEDRAFRTSLEAGRTVVYQDRTETTEREERGYQLEVHLVRHEEDVVPY